MITQQNITKASNEHDITHIFLMFVDCVKNMYGKGKDNSSVKMQEFWLCCNLNISEHPWTISYVDKI